VGRKLFVLARGKTFGSHIHGQAQKNGMLQNSPKPAQKIEGISGHPETLINRRGGEVFGFKNTRERFGVKTRKGVGAWTTNVRTEAGSSASTHERGAEKKKKKKKKKMKSSTPLSRTGGRGGEV